jgi:hypothetical protein
VTDQSDLPGVTTAAGSPVPDAASSPPPLPPGPLDLDAPAPAELVELAEVFGVATEFWDWKGAHVPVATRTILGVLAALDVSIRTGDDVLTALEDAELRPWRLLLPDVVVIRAGESAIVPVHVDHDLVDLVEVPSSCPVICRWAGTRCGPGIRAPIRGRSRTGTRRWTCPARTSSPRSGWSCRRP